nr:hypothetical protein [uncultured Flavobacterium sp.]
MTNQDLITQTVLQAKCTAACWGYTSIQQEKGGDDIQCCLTKIKVLTKWYSILEDFLCQFYESEDPDTAFICLTEEEALELVGKVKTLIKA